MVLVAENSTKINMLNALRVLKVTTHPCFNENTPTSIAGDFTLLFILILFLLVVVITVMQSFESPALVSSFKGLLTVMTFVQSFVSLRVTIFCAEMIVNSHC